MRRRNSKSMKAVFVVIFAVFIITCVLYYVLHVENEMPQQPVPLGRNEIMNYSEFLKKTTKRISKTTVSKKNELQKTAVLVIACNRPSVKRCLDALLKYKTNEMDFPILVSQDCEHRETSDTIASYDKNVKQIKLPHPLPEIEVPSNMEHFRGYFKISRHYKLALGIAFNTMGYDNVIIVEDDLEIAPDFYEYFAANIPLLHKDPTLWCISAWNDNGKKGFVQGNDILYRSDFFPGLGWALTKTLWKELELKWPASFWDDWMRHPNQRHNRACIRPEIPRTKTFGRIGVSNGQFFDQHLSKIQLNTEFFPFTKHDMSYLIKGNYDNNFKETVYNSKLVSSNDLVQEKIDVSVVRIEYNSNREFISLAKQFGLMDDLKAGVPRMAYLGIVSFMHGKYRVYIAPPITWTSYNVE